MSNAMILTVAAAILATAGIAGEAGGAPQAELVENPKYRPPASKNRG